MSEPANDHPIDEDLEMALAAFGDDLREILNESEDSDLPDFEEASEPYSDVDQTDDLDSPIEIILDRFGDKLNDESNLAYAGSIALSCLTAGDSAVNNNPRFVVFSIGQQKFAVPLASVVEVTSNVDVITPLPCTADWLKGITCLRGTMLSVTDLAELFQIPASAEKLEHKMIVVNSDTLNASTGLWVDRIHGIRILDAQPLPKTDESGSFENVFLGVASLAEDSVLMIDPDQLFGSPQLSQYTH